MKPLLLLATRAEDQVAEEEYRAFLRGCGLPAGRLRQVRLEAAPLEAGLDPRDYAAVLLGGSPFTASDPAATKSATQLRVEAELDRLLATVLAADVPFLGACYGIGTLGRHLGGVVDQMYGEPVGAVDVTLTADGVADPLLAGLPATFAAFVGHKEALRAVPAGAVLLAGSATCPVQMFRVGRHQYATQFHPELDVPGLVGRIRAYRDAGYFRPAELESLIATVRTADVRWPARILANFTARYA